TTRCARIAPWGNWRRTNSGNCINRKPASPLNYEWCTRRGKVSPAFPWQSAVDRLLATAGFVPGNHVLLSVNYRSQQLTISSDHHYRIANREMTEQEILDRIRDEQQLAAERRHRRRPPSKQA
ncbi:hypothetical protein K6W24_28580, partial [Burkholderia dolosa]|nr:hypothetical protein [Burkholderia dolosa]MBY4660370.1 hypothetical protein [Burkholderia dolosa]MBY4692427.1 hypothetical protein [Burkholderia dolosa]MBY4811785.1 hypothetical protein [Burkholderia dolosa]MBY4917793.1 hypothetical protein [Burkholderia dolosa]